MTTGSQPSGLYTTLQLAEFALQRVGAFTVNQTGADAVEVQRTLEQMDLACAELAGIEECWWLVPQTISQTLTADDSAYTLNQFASYPQQGITTPLYAYRSDGTNDIPISIWRRQEYEDIENKATGGPPEGVYIDRLADNKNVFVHPVPTDSTTTLKLVVQTFAPDVRGGEGNLAGNVAHQFDRSWQLWLINRTAYLISGGPVRKLDRADRQEIGEEASASLQALIAFHNREKPGQPRRTRPFGRAR